MNPWDEKPGADLGVKRNPWDSDAGEARMEYGPGEITRGLLTQGLTLQMADELRAMLPTAMEGQLGTGAFQQRYAQEQQRLAAMREQAGPWGLGLEAIGSVPAGLALGGPTAFATRGLPAASQQFLTGAVPGMAIGFGGADPSPQLSMGEQATSRVLGAAAGAATGGITAVATPYALQGIAEVGRRVFPFFRSGTKTALQRLARAFRADGMIDDIERVAQESARQTRLFELGDDNVLAQMDDLWTTGGAPGQKITQALRRRGAEYYALLSRAVNDWLAPEGGFSPSVKAAKIEALQAQYQPDFDAMMLSTVPDNTGAARLLQSPIIQNALRRGAGMLDDPRLARIVDDPGFDAGTPENPSLLLWHGAKRWLQGEAERFGNNPSKAGQYGAWARQVQEFMDSQTDGRYGAISRLWADSNAMEEAYDAGFDLFGSGKSRLTPEAFEAMSEAEKEMVRMGAAHGISTQLGKKPMTAEGAAPRSLFNRILGSRNQREILRRVFPSRKAYAQFQRVVRQEQGISYMLGKIRSQSATAPRTARAGGVNLESRQTGQTVTARVVDYAHGLLQRLSETGDEKARMALAEQLVTRVGTPEGQQLMRELLRQSTGQERNALIELMSSIELPAASLAVPAAAVETMRTR